MERCERCAGYGTLHRQDCGAQGLTIGCPECGGAGGRGKCERCDNPIEHRRGSLCPTCIADDMECDDTDCANCGGEGFTYGCDWDWQCDTWDGDSCLCTRRCEWCNPGPRTPADDALREVLATALPTPPHEGLTDA